MLCRCRSPLCPGQIDNFEELPADLQERLLKQKEVAGFIASRGPPKHPPPEIPWNNDRTLFPTGRTVWFMASVFATLMNARSRLTAR